MASARVSATREASGGGWTWWVLVDAGRRVLAKAPAQPGDVEVDQDPPYAWVGVVPSPCDPLPLPERPLKSGLREVFGEVLVAAQHACDTYEPRRRVP